MKLIEFPEQTTVIARNQTPYHPMPAYRFPNDPEGKIIVCWKLTWKERLKVAFTGTVWHYILTFNGPTQPQLLATERPFKTEGGLFQRLLARFRPDPHEPKWTSTPQP